MLFSLPLLLISTACAVARSTPRSTLSDCTNRTVIEQKTSESGVVATHYLCSARPRSDRELEKRDDPYYPCQEDPSCTPSCQAGSGPDLSDCRFISNVIRSGGAIDADSGSTWQYEWNSCKFMLTNIRPTPISFCADKLADNIDAILNDCSNGFGGCLSNELVQGPIPFPPWDVSIQPS